jgi:hypothetical protein
VSDDIPYEDIDVEVRRLVRLMNGLPGIRTVGSCAGHSVEEAAEISFLADSQDSVMGLLVALPFLGWRGGFDCNRPRWAAVSVDLSLAESGIVYHLRLAGFPSYAKLELVGAVEGSLAISVRETRPSSTTCASAGSGGTASNC